MMTKISLLFSGVPRYLWDEAWFNAAYVKRHLPTTANEEFKSPLHMITGDKVNIKNCNAPSRSFRATKQLCPHREGASPPLSIRMGGPNL